MLKHISKAKTLTVAAVTIGMTMQAGFAQSTRYYDYCSDVVGTGTSFANASFGVTGAPFGFDSPLPNVIVAFTARDVFKSGNSNLAQSSALTYGLAQSTGTTTRDAVIVFALNDVDTDYSSSGIHVPPHASLGIYCENGQSRGGSYKSARVRDLRVSFSGDPSRRFNGAPTITFTNPKPDAIIAAWPGLQGRYTVKSALSRIKVNIRRNGNYGNNIYWNGSSQKPAWGPDKIGLRAAILPGGVWQYRGKLPPATAGSYTLFADVLDNKKRCAVTEINIHLRKPTVRPHTVSPVTVSNGTASSAASTVHLVLTKALQSVSAEDQDNYSITVNGMIVKPSGVAYNASTNSVTVNFLPGDLPAGAQVQLQFSDVLDLQGNPLSGTWNGTAQP